MFRQIVVDTERVTSIVAEEFAHGAGRIRRDVLHRRWLGGRCSDHDRVLHRTSIFENLYDLRDGTALLADRVIDADKVVALVVDNRVEGHGSFAGLAIADNELALTSSNRDHGVNRLQPSGHGLAHRLTSNDAGSNALQSDELVGRDGTLIVDRHSERIYDAANQGVAYRDAHDAAGAL